MLGPEGAASHARSWLATRIPARLRILEARYSTPGAPVRLPDPAYVRDHEVGPLALEDWPSVFVLPLRQEGMRLVDVREDASEVYRVTYALRVLAWVRADSFASTDQLRKRYALAIRECLLERKTLTPAPTYGSERLGADDYGTDDEGTVVDPTSIREDYSDVMVDTAKRTIAGVDVTVNLIVTEVLAGPAPLGIAEELAIAPLPAHPALE